MSLQYNIQIPKNMIQIWIGPYQPPIQWMNTWKQNHQNWEYRIFDNAELSATNFKNQKLIDEYIRQKQYAGAADLIRYELLYNEGGFIPEADSICYYNTNELFDQEKQYCYTVYENEELRRDYVSPIYACNPGNKFLETIVNTLNKLNVGDLGVPFRTTGNAFLAEMIQEHNPEIKIFPSHYFIPQHFSSNKRYTGPDKVYSEQVWGTTKKRYNQKSYSKYIKNIKKT